MADNIKAIREYPDGRKEYFTTTQEEIDRDEKSHLDWLKLAPVNPLYKE